MNDTRNHPKPILLSTLAMLFLALSTLACGINLGGSSDQESVQLEQTRVALQQTQIALDYLTQDTPIETEAPPAPDVSYEGISFSFDPSIAAAFSPAIIPGQNLGEDYMPGDTYPTYYEFSINGYAVSNHFHTPVINVYPVAEFRSISTMASNIIDDLEWALANHPSGGSSGDLPFLPIWNAAQIFTAKVTYFDFQNGSGVRYLSMYGQALYPADNQNLFYTYQGLTSDGQYYISAVLPVTNPILPDDGATTVDDWMAFDQNWDNYIVGLLQTLNGQSDENFTPNLALLDEMMASFKVKP
ncbi:hypothetical protein JR338_00555 [Chloroflexota bacterium]|nr:hypothetical protein JR338_00555 [Chloroflexota bacterium]